MIYKFDQFELDTERFLLRVNGIEKSVEPQVFNLIVFLIENKDKVVTRDSILDNIWKGRVVSDTSINNHIKSARKVLGDDGTKQQVIKTIHSRGYKFVSTTEIITDLQSNSNHYDQNKVEKNVEITPQKSSPRIIFFLLPVLLTLLLAVLFYFWDQNSRTAVKGSIQAKTNSSHDNSTQSQSTAQQTIAVLPFTDTSLSKDSGYLGFALANQIISDLSYLENFSIHSASSVKHYVEQVFEPLIIGQKLQVDYVISGDYVLVNNDIKLNVSLIDVIKYQTIWQETIQVNYANTFGLQKIVAHKVAKGLHASFTENFIKHSNKSIPSNSLAYEYYLRGISYSHSNDGHKMAVEMLKKIHRA
ncbi:MAG: winged helix-turn-helix domain-containing protein [Paraglaciecola sp.]|nr:winged helix-turn-helix domain-containing protein [Paraglaciecola sp.]